MNALRTCGFLLLAAPLFAQGPAVWRGSSPAPTAAGAGTGRAGPAGSAGQNVLPYGNVPPPSGQTWIVTANDTFTQDSRIDTSLWNGCSGGGVWWCHSGNGDYCDDMGHGGALNAIDDGSQYYGTPPKAPYVTVVKGVGLVVQGYSKPGTNLIDRNESWVGLTNYGHFLQKFGYLEWCAKMPNEANGAANGLHTDLWCTPEERNQVNQSAEVDVNEGIWGSGVTKAHFCVWENTPGVPPPHGSFLYRVPGGFSSKFHVFGLYWRNDGLGAYGSVQLYVDGKPNSQRVPLNDPAWNSGVYCFAGWMQENTYRDGGTGGGPVDSRTSNANPLYVRWWRAWQFQSPSAPPIISGLLAHPATITAGRPALLSWTTAGASSLSGDHGIGTVTGRNQLSVRPTTTTTFTLTAKNGNGTVTRTVTVHVIPSNGNLIEDPGFEQQPLPNGDMLQPPWYGVGNELIGVVKANGKSHSGHVCAYIKSTGKYDHFWNAVAQTIPVKPHTDYVLTGWVCDSAGRTFTGGQFGVRTNRGAIRQASIPKTGAFTRLRVAFNSGARTSVVVYAGFVPVGYGAWLHVDDVALTRAPATRAGGVAKSGGTARRGGIQG